MASSPSSRPSKIFEEAAVSLAPLTGKRVAVLGFGNQGRAHALNLKDSGIDVLVGLRPGSPSRARARADGLEVDEVGAAVAFAAVVAFLVPDEVQADLHRRVVLPNLKPDAALAFAHGFAVAFDQIRPEPGRACFLVAPKGQGDSLRAAFARGGGLPGLLAVTEDSPEGTWELAAAYARAVGCLRGGGFPTTFVEEAVTDQFGEQVVLCGGLIELLQGAFDTLVEAGYSPENAYFECVHELKIIADLLHRRGVDGMRRLISPTAAYGGLTRGPRVIDDRVRGRMREILGEIARGDFAREFLSRHLDPAAGTAALAAREAESPLVRAGRTLQERLSRLDLDGGSPGDLGGEPTRDSGEKGR